MRVSAARHLVPDERSSPGSIKGRISSRPAPRAPWSRVRCRNMRSRHRGAGLGAIVEGPIGAETAVRKAHAGTYDAVVAMYHDQATIPMKLVGFGDAVNVTLGLPIVRTSVDHGTGYDIAGRGVADARGMRAAIELAVRLVTKK